MKNIGNYQLQKSQIGAHKYRVIIFENDRSIGCCEMTLMPTGNVDELPVFTITKRIDDVPDKISSEQKTISDWIKSQHRF